MDIQKWLDETVLPEQRPSPPARSENVTTVAPVRAGQASKGERRRRHTTSDSSLLDAPPPRRRAPPIARKADIEQDAHDSAYSDASRPASGSESSTSNPYARRPRRKTRPERYEPSSKDVKERGAHAHRHQKGESNRTDRKSRRRKGNKPGSGIAQSFRAKNILQDRLTLKPREKLGIFSKGRASSPVRGRGLPDLVFQEMKFLQKHKDEPPADPQAAMSRKKRRKDHAHAKEDEISAYFTSVRPALTEKEVNIQAKEGSHPKRLRETDRRKPERLPVGDNAIPTIELPDKGSYLGFGGRGPRHESGSYVSWSESIRAPSGTPVRLQVGPTVNAGQLDSVHDGEDRGDANDGERMRPQPKQPTLTCPVTKSSSGRFQVSSLAPANDRMSRSHSLPQHTSSPRRPNPVDRAAKHPTLDTAASPSSMPPRVPARTCLSSTRRRSTYPGEVSGAIDAPFPGAGSDSVLAEDDTRSNDVDPAVMDEEPQSSSSLGRILTNCNTVFNERRWAAASHVTNSVLEEPYMLPAQGRTGTLQSAYPTVQRIPTVRFSGFEMCGPRLPNFSGPSIYQQQEQRQHLTGESELLERSIIQGACWPDGGGFERDNSDYEVNELGGLPAPASYDEDPQWRTEDIVETYCSHDELKNIEQRNDDVAHGGFWRPHKLY